MNDLLNNLVYQYSSTLIPDTIDRNNRNERKFSSDINSIKYDLLEDEKVIDIYFEIPGVLKSDIVIDVCNNKLKVKVNKEQQYTRPKYSELKYGKFTRSIDLSICVTKKETVKTNYINGLLHIRIEKFIEEENAFSISGNEIPEITS
jgi:HSP20 family molecular chaperone IbpA